MKKNFIYPKILCVVGHRAEEAVPGKGGIALRESGSANLGRKGYWSEVVLGLLLKYKAPSSRSIFPTATGGPV